MKKLFIVMFLLFPIISYANDNIDYVIDNFKIGRIDKDATIARQKAMTKGQRDAFNIILERLNIDSTNGIIVSNDEISQMLRSMQIKNERITDNSYNASLTLEFSPEYVDYILNKYKINRYSLKFNSYLIIPVLNKNGELYLWEKDNDWMYNFKKNLRGNKNIFLIEDDYSTRNLIGKNYFKNPTYSKFKNLLELYNVNNAVVIIGNYNKNNYLINIKIKIINMDYTKNAYMDYEIKNPDDLKIDLNEAEIKIIEYIKTLDQENEVDEEAPLNIGNGTIYIYAPISSIYDYNNINNILTGNKNLIDLRLKMISKNMAIYSVKYDNENIEYLINLLKESGFSVNEKKEGLYIFYE